MKTKIKVIDSVGFLTMFEATIEDSWLHMLTMRSQIMPHVKNVVKVDPGTGNSGLELEYQIDYDGYCVKWEDFVTVGFEAQ